VKVIVLGSGVIGVTIAYYLRRAEHEVTVVDRQIGPALETSYANAGEISPGYAAPWAGPGIPLKVLRWMFMKHRPLVIRPLLDPAMWLWGLRMLANCTHERYEINKGRMLRLAEYSRDCLRQLRADTHIRYDERSLGTLQLFRTQKQLDGTASDIAILRRYDVPYQLLDRDGCVNAEPALAGVRERIAGGLRLPADETGDCFKFAQALAQLAERLGAKFSYNVNIQRIRFENGEVTGIVTDTGELQADAYIVALGSYSPLMLSPLGLHLPIYPVKGYSITVPITDPTGAPESTVMDETFKVAVTRLGDRIRVGGTAELAGYNLRLRGGRRRTLEHVIRDLFPRGGDVSKATFWTGLRPMTPDGTPIIGRSPYPNLYLSTGHGTLGWTMAAGTGRVVADLISGRQPEIEAEDFTLARYDTARKHPPTTGKAN
jgi:D-amino-acid dehydrogenase